MANVGKTITFEGTKYSLGNEYRVAAQVAVNHIRDELTSFNTNMVGTVVNSGSTGHAGATSGQLFLTGSNVLLDTNANDGATSLFDIVCLKK